MSTSTSLSIPAKAGPYGEMNVDLSYLDIRRVSTPETYGGHDGDRADVPRKSVLLNKNAPMSSQPFGCCSTLAEMFFHGKRVSEDGPCLGWRPEKEAPYTFFSFSETEQRAKDLISGLVDLGVLEPGNPESFLGIYSQNRVEWMVAAFGCWMYTTSIVPLYDTLGPESCSFILNQTETSCVLCDTEAKAKSLLGRLSDTPSLKKLVVIETVGEEVKATAERGGIVLISWNDVLAKGKENPVELSLPKPDDLAIICYTSGTTGNPKGAMLTHANYCGTVAGVLEWCKPLNLTPAEAHISYLPLAHVFEQSVLLTIITLGGRIGFYQGDIKLLTSDMQALGPTVFPTVPRLLNRMYDTVRGNVSGSRIKSFVFNWALKKKKSDIEQGIFKRDTLWDYIAFKKIHQTLGGCVKAIFSGSAPLDPNVMEFARAGMGAYMMEGYGQTECAGVATVQLIGERTTGEVGPPLPCQKIKLVDVPEMGYFARDNKGEICMKGTNVFKGYYKDPQRTQEALDEDGWLHTGDIGLWSPSGSLKIIDRKKNIFKLAQGEYVAPEKIETVYARSALVGQVFVHGESLKSVLVAVVVPDEDATRKWAAKNNNNGADGESSLADLVADPALKAAILEDMVRVGKEAKLASFEQVKDIYLEAEMWTPENDLLTPTFKVKRGLVLTKYRQYIDEMYEQLW